MTGIPHSDTLPSIGDLARYLDKELEPQRRAALEHSLQRNPDLAAAFHELEAGDAAMRAWASDLHDPPLPAAPDFGRLRHARRNRLIAAAVVLLIGTGLLAASPAGAALIQGLRAAAAWVTGSETDFAPLSIPAVGEPVRVSAPLQGTRFSVEVREPWPGGKLRLQPGSTGEVSAWAPPGGAVELLFLEARLVVNGQADPGSEVIVSVPPLVEVVEVTISNSDRRTVRMGVDQVTVVELAGN